MCQRHGLLYFYVAAPESSPIMSEDFMCGDWNPSAQPSAADQHHTANPLQTNVALVFLAPALSLLAQTDAFATPLTLESQDAQPFALAPLRPPPRLLLGT
ncbi:MAG: hypothetical protein D6749_10525 [Chloroflexota bacterium]|nr:MAG: hypothetical protein D6749_10525 [Chloroflexota bacterium]